MAEISRRKFVVTGHNTNQDGTVNYNWRTEPFIRGGPGYMNPDITTDVEGMLADGTLVEVVTTYNVTGTAPVIAPNA